MAQELLMVKINSNSISSVQGEEQASLMFNYLGYTHLQCFPLLSTDVPPMNAERLA